jgi:hypothetical protein
MASIIVAGDTSGSVTLQAPAVAGSTVLNLPSTSGTIQTSGAGYTTNGVAYATSATGLATGSALTFDGTSFKNIGPINASIGAYSANNASSQFVLGNSAGTAHWLMYETIGASGQIGNLNIYDGTAAAIRLTVDTSGNLLVGTTSAGAKLDVSAANGTTPMIRSTNTTSGNSAGFNSSLQTAANNTSSYHFYGSTLAIGNWYLYGNGTSSWSSDERLKKNIVTTRDGYLEDICKLRVVKYQWKNGPDQVELGLIAQEVEQVFPGLVQDDLNTISPDDPTIYKQLKGSVLPFMLLKAIQEQQALINTLTERISVLENK